MTSGSRQREFRDILETGWSVSREGVPVPPGTLLYRHRYCLRPERVTPPPERIAEIYKLMATDVRIELQRVSPR